MKLRDTRGIRFSELHDNWEERSFFWHDPWGKKKEGSYRHYGDLSDGRHFGAGYVPAFGDPWGWEMAILIVQETGELYADTFPFHEKFPLAAAASPSGRSIVWLTEDKNIGAWHQEKECFVLWDSVSLKKRLGNAGVQDAVMHDDGILEIYLEDGGRMGYHSDADIVLNPYEEGWIPRSEECGSLSYALKNGELDAIPDSVTVLISENDCWGEYAGRGVKRVCFEEGLERIEGEILADNPELEAVVIPASIRYADWHAFGNCTNLKDLVIEGDPARTAGWDRDAFEGCACEEYYKQLRNHAE